MAERKDTDARYSTGQDPVGNDNNRALENKFGIDPRSLSADLVMALRFYSRLPTGASPHETPVLDRMAPVLPLASVLIGLAPVIVMAVGIFLGLPALLSACLGVGAQVAATGAMAEDASADSADGLWGGSDVEKRLTIMKDPRHGTYGVLALVLLIAIRLSALSALMLWSGLGAALLWLAAQMVARQGALWLVLALPPARSDGLAQAAGTLSPVSFAAGGAIAGLLFFVFSGALIGVAGMTLTLIALGLTVWGWSRLCRSRVGGFTGDLIGALQALLEIAALSSFILFI
ncbi:MAG TPA: adenosylcobinamide-GDP ribazoletransferase [Devosia sp.]|nr:adenosylcobinamide-GDP ribazoletransferase [Devosia sp.]